MQTKSTVSITRCQDYDPAQVYQAVKTSLEQVDGVHELLKNGKKKVLLKPNLLSASLGPEHPVNTHPVVVRALVDFFQKEGGAEVYIGDSCGSLRSGSTNKAFKVARLDEVAQETGARWINFDQDKPIEITKNNGATLPTFKMASIVKDVDLVVSVPKLKTHGLTKYTGALKNTMGVIPANGKKNVHVQAPKPSVFAKALIDIYEEVRPHLTVIDGIVGMEGNGPNAGDPRKVGLIMASTDGVALDAVASAVIGYEPMSIPTTRYAQERALGIADLHKIKILGPKIQEVAIPDFKKTSNAFKDFALNYLPGAVFAKLFDMSTSCVSSVYEPNCTRCYACVRNCPAGAMSTVEGRVVVDEKKCIGCFCCDEVCDYKAIKMKRSTMGQLFVDIAKYLRVERT
jgi:uncharacterized protein (DUF362 family)/Pyruvate/2-oxoacid:ferredoxin oxidoreductase delta subunit